MPNTYVRHSFGGGWATDFGTDAELSLQIDAFGVANVTLPFLVDADNSVFELDGGPHKAPGAVKLNSSVVESGADIRGIFDFWIQGTSGSPTQKRIIHAGTKILKDDSDGTFDDLFTGLEADKVPDYTIFGDLLIVASDSAVDVPRSWDGTTAQNLAGSPPNFAFSVEHKNRVWAAGNVAAPSTLYFAVSEDGADWTGSGSGNIKIALDDGDKITGLASHRGDLFVFKGPYKGSIHRITGSAPTGSDAFARRPFIQSGLGCVAHNSIFNFGSDLGFMWADGSVHSLNATAEFGDFDTVALSRPIHKWMLENVNFSALNTVSCVTSQRLGITLMAYPITGGSVPNVLLMMDFRFSPVRWSLWSSFTKAICLGSVIDTASSNIPIVFSGDTDGFVRKLEQTARSIDGADGLSYKITSPVMNYSMPHIMKTLANIGIGFRQQNDQDVTFGWTRDNNTQQTQIVNQQGGTGLGSFKLGTSKLGGAQFIESFYSMAEGGEFRSIQWEISNNTVDEDVEVHRVSLDLEITNAISFEND
jgi:hypothetical protein